MIYRDHRAGIAQSTVQCRGVHRAPLDGFGDPGNWSIPFQNPSMGPPSIHLGNLFAEDQQTQAMSHIMQTYANYSMLCISHS